MNVHAPPARWPFGERVRAILDEAEANTPPASRALDLIAPEFRRFRNLALSAAPRASDCEVRRVAIALGILTEQFAKMHAERSAQRTKGRRIR